MEFVWEPDPVILNNIISLLTDLFLFPSQNHKENVKVIPNSKLS
jgi:hypothetical protein